jgi:hypothetical protein
MSNRLPCSKCKAMTMLARITPGPPGFDIHTFECLACNRVYQRVVERVDPNRAKQPVGSRANCERRRNPRTTARRHRQIA